MKKLLALLPILLFSALLFSQKSQLRIFKKNFKTYMYSDPDPVPHPESNIYPYFRFDGYTDTPVDKEWTIIELENEWIKVHITPEIGGKIWGAWEKSTGFPFIYANDVVKFRDVAMRGAWTSGGIEFNFGDIGHAPTVATPVDWTTRENPDGSVSCFVGAIDLSSRTRWMVEINLPPDKAYFTTRSRWYNPTPFETSYYHWMNGGFRAEGDLEFCFPGTNYIGHEGELHPWPIDEKGRDLSFYKNNDFGSYKSYHVLGEYTDWFGGYWHDDEMGVVHYSPYAEKLGKKIWIWGLSRQGYIWEDLLTDNSGQYVELQSGRLFNQASPGSINSPFKHVAFKPYTTDEWTEYWYPVKGTGGIEYADNTGTLNIETLKDSVKVSFCPVQAFSDSLTVIMSGAEYRQILAKKITLKPMEVFSETVAASSSGLPFFMVRIGNRSIIVSSEKTGEVVRPLQAPENFDWGSAFGLYLKGKDLMNQRNNAEALPHLLKAVELDPHLLPALNEAAEIYLRQKQYDQVKHFTGRVLEVNAYNAKANFLRGLVSEGEGGVRDGVEFFATAALDPAYRSAANFHIAKHYFIARELDKAYAFANDGLLANPLNLECANLIVACYRLSGKNAGTFEMIQKLLDDDPLNYIARFEKYLLTGEDADKQAFLSVINNELAHETFVEITNWYIFLDMTKDAMTLLEMAPFHPKTEIWKAYIGRNAADVKKWTKNFLSAEGFLFFPDRDQEVGSRLVSRDLGEESWKTDYYAGLIFWRQNRIDEAKKAFHNCAGTPDEYPFYLAQADLFRDDPTVVLASLERAWALDPTAWRTVVRLANFYLENGNPAKALEYAESGIKAHPKHSPMGIVYAKALNANGLYEKCADFLKKFKVLPAEGAYEAHSIWREANLNVALDKMETKKWRDALPWLDAAMDWPENLGSGKPYFPDERLPMLLKSNCFKKLKRQGEAQAAAGYLLTYQNPDETPGFLGEFLTAMKLGEDGNVAEAIQQLEKAGKAGIPEDLYLWCVAKVQGVAEHVPGTVAVGTPESRDWKVLFRFLKMN